MKCFLASLLLIAALAGGEPVHVDFSGPPPSSWSAPFPDGNYAVTLTFGGPEATDTTVRAEARRLYLTNLRTEPGKLVTRTFIVNVRSAALPDGRRVKTNAREANHPNWDDKLSLEFTGTHPGVKSLDVRPAPAVPTVYLAGDSTVTDQQNEPWSSWGQVLPLFFKPDIAIANHAESGLALRSFRSQLRLEKVLTVLKPGDYVFVQFGHNDEKEKGEGVGAMTTYRADLKKYVAEIRAKGGSPVLVTSMQRRRFEGDRLVDTHGDYPKAVREVAAEDKVPLIDLQRSSNTLFNALGPATSEKAFVHYPANSFPGQDKALSDNTHFNTYGGWLLAKCMVEGIRASVPELAKHLQPDLPVFDPAKPDPPSAWNVPPSRSAAENLTTPAGN